MPSSPPLPLTPIQVSTIVPTGQDITYTHSVFAQCFLPLRRLKAGERRYQVKHGNAGLYIRAGDLINPVTRDMEEQEVPAGAAARLIFSHIHNHIIRAGSLDEAIDVPMGDSLRAFFRDYRLNICGPNGKQIRQQVNNIAAAQISIAVWNEHRVRQVELPRVARQIDFWLEEDARQRTLWQPSMVVNPEYARTIRERAVPLDMRALVGLYARPRAMDVFVWLSYRLPLVKEARGIYIPYFGDNGLHTVFGRTLQQKNKFREEFIKTLHEVAQWYPDARVEIQTDGIRLFPSPSPIPPEHSLSHGRSLFFCR